MGNGVVRPVGARMPALGWVLLGVAGGTTAIVFALVVVPVLTGAVRPVHSDHWGWVLLHALTGTVLLLTGPLNLYVGQTRRGFAWHRRLGGAYLGAGYTAALAALAVNWRDPHGSPSIALSTSLLALAWMLCASLGWRRGSQRQIAAHRDWMIRSYVLVWSFVLCRLVQRSELFEGSAALIVWLTWTVPLLLCEAVLWRRRWRRTTGVP